MLRSTSKRFKDVVDKMRLPAVVRLSRSWNWAEREAKLDFVVMQLAAMTVWCRPSRLELRCLGMQGQYAQKLAGLLGPCRELVHLDLSWNGFQSCSKGVSGEQQWLLLNSWSRHGAHPLLLCNMLLSLLDFPLSPSLLGSRHFFEAH